MKPPKRDKIEYERIPKYDDWIEGKIEEIEYEENHKRSFKGEEKVGPCIRFKFSLQGCSFSHRSRWMSFSYSEKSNLYKKYLSMLIEDAEPDMDFDIELLKGFKVKTMWIKDGEFDKLEMIRPLKEKLTISPVKEEDKTETEVPF